MRVFARLLTAGFRQRSAYLGAAWGRLAANATFGFLKAGILGATVVAAGGSVGGYDLAQMMAFVWLGQGLLGAVDLNGTDTLARRIRTGDVAVDFARPLDLQLSRLASFLGERLFSLIPRGLPSIAIGLALTPMTLPLAAGPYLLGAVALVLGMALSFAVVYLVQVLAFWLVEVRGLQVLYMSFAGFFSGLFVPVGLFPGWLQGVAAATPFPSMLMTTIEIVSGRVTGSGALGLVAVQVCWLAGALAAGQVLTRQGRSRLEIQGG
ncbi:ABC transporter permease [Pseudonocardia sp. HH130630-07]|uniref:ABC transporter permease n=1 Tax=Pseudonocardia sp. HH130630-07 TaxID=1690815 RepID=UPI0018D3AA57|nr:ABC-2 family transporter protein [Pseudonocardia sp. HH130630-07]